MKARSRETAAWILYPSRAYLPQKVRVMVDFLKEKLRRSGE
jgi:DNA-binding transcriptional LysR family regulator